MNDFKVSTLEETDSKLDILAILSGTTIVTFNGTRFLLSPISEHQIGESSFPNLKRPGVVEIPSEEAYKTLLVTGGLDSQTQRAEKLSYIVNLLKLEDGVFALELNFKFADMPAPKYLHNSILLNKRFVLSCGGKNESTWLSSCEVLDLKTKKWEVVGSMLDKRANFDTTVINDTQIYAFGGFSDVKKFSVPMIELCNFNGEDLKSLKWQSVNLKLDIKPLSSMRTIEYCGSILVFGGFDGQKLQDDVYEIDFMAKSSTKIGKLNSARGNFHLLKKGDDIYVAGGTFISKKAEDNSVINYCERISIGFGNKITTDNIPLDNFIIDSLTYGESNFDIGFAFSGSAIFTNLKEFN